HHDLGDCFLYAEGTPELLFTDNETNSARLFGVPSRRPYVKDAFHERIVGGNHRAVNPAKRGTKAGIWRKFLVPARGTIRWALRLGPEPLEKPFADAEVLLVERRREADEFYAAIQGNELTPDRRAIHRQACAGLFWTMQYYHYDVDIWLDGDA